MQDKLKISHIDFLNEASFVDFSDFLKNESGIDLGKNKQYLVVTRLKKILADQGVFSIQALLDNKHLLHSHPIKECIIDAMTTNETLWFRDVYPYDYLKNILLPNIKKMKKKLNIWSCACSSGQEPYSISMIFDEFNQSSNTQLDFNITATDLSNNILNHAIKGEYDKLSVVRGLSTDRLNRYFYKNIDDKWEVKSSIKKNITFKKINLKDNYFVECKYDVVFCRNVLIYFSRELKNKIIRNIHSNMNKGGYLFLGASESLADTNDLFDLIYTNPGIIYRAK